MAASAQETVKILARCSTLGELLASLYHVTSTQFSLIRRAMDGRSGPLEILRAESGYWDKAVRASRLLQAHARSIANQLSRRYRSAQKDDHIWLGLFALLRILDRRARLQNQDAILREFRDPCAVANDLSTAEYHILPKQRSLIAEQIESLPAKERFRDAEDLAPRLGDYLDHLAIVHLPPSRQFNVALPSEPLRKKLETLGHDIRIGVFPLGKHIDFEFTKAQPDGDIVHFEFTGIKNAEQVWGDIETVLTNCRDGADGGGPVHIIVFPELTITPTLERRIAEWLRTENTDDRIVLVVAGSFHRRDLDDQSRLVNASCVLQFDGDRASGTDARGHRVEWVHRKMNAFRFTKANLGHLRTAEMPRFQTFLDLFHEGAESGVEGIQDGNELLLFDLPIGRTAVVICLDYLADHDARLLQDLGVGLVFVPTMSDDTEQFDLTNRRLGTNCQTSTFCANSAWVVPDGCEAKGAPFIYTPVTGSGYRMHPGPSVPHSRFLKCAMGGLILHVGSISLPSD
ncbi:hypothetical protein HQ560_17985 [bacterium]|nr:hypothetical protein [bacterium]